MTMEPIQDFASLISGLWLFALMTLIPNTL